MFFSTLCQATNNFGSESNIKCRVHVFLKKGIYTNQSVKSQKVVGNSALGKRKYD